MNEQPKRPGSVMVAAILLLIFGIYGTLQGFCSLGSLLLGDVMTKLVAPPMAVPPVAVPPVAAPQQDPGNAPPGPAPPVAPAAFNQMDLRAFLAKEEPSYMVAEGAASIMRLLLGIGAIVAGAWAMKLKPRGRVLGMSVALGSLLLVLAETVYNLVFLLPPINHFLDEQAKIAMGPAPGPMPAGFGSLMLGLKGLIGGLIIFGALFSAAIWLAVFLLLRSQKARDAFAGKLVEETDLRLPQEERRASVYTGYDDEDQALPPLPKPAPPGTPPETGIKDLPGSP